MVASSHNGGRTQFNTAGLGYSGSFEFLNILKTSQDWSYVTSGGAWVDPGDCAFDANDYPTAIPVGKGGVSRKAYMTTQSERSGNWVVLWDGGGTIHVSGGTTVGGTSKTSTAGTTNNRYEFSMSGSPTTDYLEFGVAAVLSSSEYPHNIRVCHIEDEPALLAGGIFGVKFLAKLRESGVGVLRFLSWMGSGGNGANDTALTTWASRRPVGSASYAANEFRTSLFAGVTTNTGDAFSITPVAGYVLGNSAPVHNEGMIVKWSATASGSSPTLTKGGATKPVMRPNGTLLAPGLNTGRPALNLYAYVVFNSVLDAWLCFGSTTASSYLTNGCPPEIMVALCSELGVHPYFPCPFLAADPITDYMPSLAAYIRDSGPSWMIPRFEGPNESWNSASAFYSTQYAKAIQLLDNGGSLSSNPTYTATAMSWTGSGTSGTSTITIGTNNLRVGSTVILAASSGPFGINNAAANVTEIVSSSIVKINRAPTGGSYTGGVSVVTLTPSTDDGNNWYGKIISGLGQAIAAVYSTVKANVKTQVRYQMIAGVQTFTTPSASNERMATTSYVLRGGDPASDWATHICCAQYYSPSVYEGATEATLATAYAGGDLTAPTTYIGYLGGAASGFNLATCTAAYVAWKAWAQGYGINKMCGYEGGYSPDYSGSTNLDNLRKAGKAVTDLLYYNTDNIESFIAQTDGSFTAEFPSNFIPFGKLPDDNVWAIMVNIYQTPDPPQWTSIRLFNGRYSRKRLVATV